MPHPWVRKGAGFEFAPSPLMERKRNPLKRFYRRGDLHFVTFSCYRRRAYPGTIRARHKFALDTREKLNKARPEMLPSLDTQRRAP